ncbi:unnamed protein product, partial [Effrenium voratum]
EFAQPLEDLLAAAAFGTLPPEQWIDTASELLDIAQSKVQVTPLQLRMLAAAPANHLHDLAK